MRLTHWFRREYRLAWWLRTRSSIIAWCCNQTGGHRWAGPLIHEMPKYGDHTTFCVSVLCQRCRQMMYRTSGVSAAQEAAAIDPEFLNYFKQRLIREMLADTAGKARPVFNNFKDWMRNTQPIGGQA